MIIIFLMKRIHVISHVMYVYLAPGESGLQAPPAAALPGAH